MRVVQFSNNLMVSGGAAAAARAAGASFALALSDEQCLEHARAARCDLVILDLAAFANGAPGAARLSECVRALRALPEPPLNILAHGPHVRTELLAAARQAGCDEVLPNSQLQSRLADLGRLAADGTSGAAGASAAPNPPGTAPV